MIKKIVLLAFASIIAVSSVASAAPNKKKFKVTNASSVGYFYKVKGGKPIYIAPGSSKSFPIPQNKKKITIKTSLTKNGGSTRVFSLTRSEAKSSPAIATNPVTGQHTDISK